MSKRVVSNAVERSQIKLDSLNVRAVVLDRNGDAWQLGGIGKAGMYWYRAYGDSSEVTSWALAQLQPITVIHN